jgi:hypothetical protein
MRVKGASTGVADTFTLIGALRALTDASLGCLSEMRPTELVTGSSVKLHIGIDAHSLPSIFAASSSARIRHGGTPGLKVTPKASE